MNTPDFLTPDDRSVRNTAETNEREDISPSMPAPKIRRRLTCMLYEGVLLFGVLMAAGLLFSSLTEQRNAMLGRHQLQAFLFVVLAIYFTWFWSHGGQTVAMKTWNIRLVDSFGAQVSQGRALARYVASWIWFVPVLALLYLEQAKSLSVIFGAMGAWVAIYAALAAFSPGRQFWHDTLCGTRLITVTAKPKSPQSTSS